jgi:hypothetical protein
VPNLHLRARRGCFLLNEDFSLHGTDFLEYERKVKTVIWAECLLQTSQHDMDASRLKSEFFTARDHHIIYASAVGVHK